MVCSKCDTLQGVNNITIESLDYPKDAVANGELFSVTIKLTCATKTGPYSTCIYVNNVIGSTETITFPGWNTSVTKTYQIRMGSSDTHINISIIDEGLLWSNCDNFQDIVVYYKAAVAPRQSCLNGICIPTLNGTFANLTECRNSGCKEPVDTKACNDPLKLGCTSGIPNSYLVGGALLFMMMMKK
jgi:hypothetical protein